MWTLNNKDFGDLAATQMMTPSPDKLRKINTTTRENYGTEQHLKGQGRKGSAEFGAEEALGLPELKQTKSEMIPHVSHKSKSNNE